jgi:hypothetical protein
MGLPMANVNVHTYKYVFGKALSYGLSTAVNVL